MNKLLIVLLLLAATPLQSQQRVLSIADFGTPTTVVLANPPYVPSVYGESFLYGSGLAIFKVPDTRTDGHRGHWHNYTSSWKPEVILEHEVPPMLSGFAALVQAVGTIPHYGQMGGGGVFYDEAGQRICLSSGASYTTNNGLNTLSCALVNPVTGKLVMRTNPTTGASEVDRRSWTFRVCTAAGVCTPRGDRMTQSGMLRVRSETLATKLHGHYVVGFGGYYSIIYNSISMGFSGCAFELPPHSDVSGKITCTPVLGYPVHSTGGSTYLNRDGNYNQTLGWDANPQRGSVAVAMYGFGKFAPADGFNGMAADIVEANGGAAFVGFGEFQQGCIAYGDNYCNLPPILFDGVGIKPTATDLTTGVVTIPASWPTGRMVNVVSSSGSGGWGTCARNVHYVHEVGPGRYTFHTTAADATTGANVEIPTAAVTSSIRPVSWCQSPTPYPVTPAQIGSQGSRHALYFYDLEELAAVAAGLKSQEAVQPKTFGNIALPNITYPTAGMGGRAVTGVQWVPELNRFFVSVRDTTATKQGRRIYAFPPVSGTPVVSPAEGARVVR